MSSANWLAMDAAGFPPGVGAPVPGELLKARLLGACAEELAPPGRPRAGTPDWPALQRSAGGPPPGDDLRRQQRPARLCLRAVSLPMMAGWQTLPAMTGAMAISTPAVIVGRRAAGPMRGAAGQRLTADNSVRFCRLIGPDGRPGRDRFQRAPLADPGG